MTITSSQDEDLVLLPGLKYIKFKIYIIVVAITVRCKFFLLTIFLRAKPRMMKVFSVQCSLVNMFTASVRCSADDLI